MGVSENRGVSPKSSIEIGFSCIFTIHFGVPYFWKHPYVNIIVGGNQSIFVMAFDFETHWQRCKLKGLTQWTFDSEATTAG